MEASKEVYFVFFLSRELITLELPDGLPLEFK